LLAPGKVRWQANEQQNGGELEVPELIGVMESQEDGVPNDGASGKNKENRRPRVPGDAIGNWLASASTPNRKSRRRSQSIENPADEDHSFDQLLKRAQFSGADEYCRPYAKRHDGEHRCVEIGMHDRELLEKKIIVRHRIENSRCS